jgi:medium-chain acyl-[acyl-carrier-protein] hydrolase
MKDLHAIANEVTRLIQPLLDRPFAFFGHSMGALVAFETARRLRDQGNGPQALFLSAREAPHLSKGREPLESLPDDEFIDAMDRIYGGVPAILREDFEFRDIYLPPLRADVTAVSHYRLIEGIPLDCPIHVLGGLSDRSVSRESLNAWDRHTAGRFGVHLFPGDHFYVNTARVAVISVVAAELAHTVGSTADRKEVVG